MKKIWVVGAQGMLGRAVVDLCCKRGIATVGTGKEDADVSSMKSLESRADEVRPSHIINCAAYTDVDGAEKNAQQAYAVNAFGAENLSLIARRFGSRLISISSDYVFHGKDRVSYREEDACQPVNAYGMSKWEGEKLIFSSFPEACIVRTSWLYGWKGKNFISSLLHWLIEKEEVNIVADQWSCPTYVWDLADAVLALLDEKGMFHFANEGAATRFEIAQAMLDGLREKTILYRCQNIQPVSRQAFSAPASRPQYSILGTDKFAKLKYPPRPWQEGLKEFLSHAQ